MVHAVPGLESARITRPGYAIEYDYLPPTQLHHSFESRAIRGLYFAGQVNGTTGYEEAAGQGLMAGLNAARATRALEPIVLRRDQAMIGVLIDDLVTRGVDEPYRLFTSRAEYRLLLRQDNALRRLLPLAETTGLLGGEELIAAGARLRSEEAVPNLVIVIFIGIVPFVTYCQQFSFQQKIASENRQMFSLFGFSATFYKKYLMIGSPLSEDVTYLYEKKLNTWELIQTLTPSDPTVNKYFGFSTYMNDSIIIIGAVGDNNARGAAYFYEKDVTGLWIEKQKLIPPVVLFDVENFGSSVTIFKNRLIIVAPRDNHDAFELNPIFETGCSLCFWKGHFRNLDLY